MKLEKFSLAYFNLLYSTNTCGPNELARANIKKEKKCPVLWL